jgi:hypothetical protein
VKVKPQTKTKPKIKIKTKPKTEIDALRADLLARIPWLVHGFSTRSGGFSNAYGGKALNLGFTSDDSKATVERNRQAFASTVGAKNRKSLWPLVTLRQIHSDLIHCVSEVPRQLLAGDGLMPAPQNSFWPFKRRIAFRWSLPIRNIAQSGSFTPDGGEH